MHHEFLLAVERAEGKRIQYLRADRFYVLSRDHDQETMIMVSWFS